MSSPVASAIRSAFWDAQVKADERIVRERQLEVENQLLLARVQELTEALVAAVTAVDVEKARADANARLIERISAS